MVEPQTNDHPSINLSHMTSVLPWGRPHSKQTKGSFNDSPLPKGKEKIKHQFFHEMQVDRPTLMRHLHPEDIFLMQGHSSFLTFSFYWQGTA